MKTFVKFNNKIQAIDDCKHITITLIVPAGNIQRMIDATNCTVVSKQRVELAFNHHAGVTYSVTILVRFGNIKKYLKSDHISGAVNVKEYLDIIGYDGRFGISYNDSNLITDKCNLYAFGELYRPVVRRGVNGIYVNKEGKKISLTKTDKYVNFKGEYFRLIEVKS